MGKHAGIGGQEILRDIAHPRHECATHKFYKGNHERLNTQHCANCWCYVCDVKAPCAAWSRHCSAYPCFKWNEERRLKLARMPPRAAAAANAGDGNRRNDDDPRVMWGEEEVEYVDDLDVEIRVFMKDKDFDEYRIECPPGSYFEDELASMCNKSFLHLHYKIEEERRIACVTRKELGLSHNGRFLAHSNEGHEVTELMLDRLSYISSYWVFLETRQELDAACKQRGGGPEDLGIAWWGTGFYKHNAPAQVYARHFEKYDDIPENSFPRSDEDFDNYDKIFNNVRALVGGPAQSANREVPTTLIQHIARVRITGESRWEQIYEVLAARACMRLIHKNVMAYKNRIGEAPNGQISYVCPPRKVPLPDPAGIAEAAKLGSVSIPVRASKERGLEYTEERIAEELAKAPHGFKFSSKQVWEENMRDGKDPDLTNLFNYKSKPVYLTSRNESVGRRYHEPFLEAMPIFSEGDPKPRLKVPLRVLFVDSRNAKAEWTICEVKNNDKVANVGNVVEELAKRYELNENEQIVLATVLYRPENVTKSPMRCKAFSEVQVVHNMRTEPACNLPNFYRPFSRIENNREDNSEKILVAYKTKKAQKFRIVHPVLKKTLKQRISPWEESETNKDSFLKGCEQGDYLQPCSIPIIIDAEGATEVDEKKELRKICAPRISRSLDSQVDDYFKSRSTWDVVEFPSSLTGSQRNTVHRAASRKDGIRAVARGSGNERRMCLVKTNSMYPETGGISEATLLRKNTEPLLKACMKKYVSEESSRKRDRDGAKVKREEAVTISHFLHSNKVDDPLINRRGLDHAVKSGRVHSFSTPLRNPSKFYNTDNGAAFNSAHVTAVIEIDDESVEMLAGVKRGLLPGSADSTAEAIEDLKKTKDIIDAQLCECRAIERSQRMCAEIFNAVTTYFRRSYNVSRETRLRNFSTCEQDRVACTQPDIRVTAKMRKQTHDNARETWYLDVDIYVQKPGTFARVQNNPYHHGFACDSAFNPPAFGFAPALLFEKGFRKQDSDGFGKLRVTIPHISKNARLKREANEVEACFRAGHDAVGAVGLMKALEMQEYPSVEQPAGLTVTMHDYQRQTLNRMIELEMLPGGFRDLLWYDVNDVMKNLSPEAAKKKWMYSPGFDQIADITHIPKTPKGGFLCEEMGLGKTIEVLALILAQKPPQGWIEHGETLGNADTVIECTNMANGENVKKLHRSGATLVICAVSLVGQWIDEAKSKLDEDSGLRILMYHGSGRERNPKKIAENYDLVVTTYQTLAADRSRTNPLGEIEFYRLVCDESHMTKSYLTAQSKAASEICAARRWACTGTPIATNSVDLFGQMAMLGVSPWGIDIKRFREDFNNIICKSAGKWNRYSMTERSSEEIKRVLTIMKPMTIRHTKTQKLGRNATKDLLSLPPKTVIHVPVTLLPEEQRLYDEIHAETKDTWETKYKAKGHAFVAKHTFGIMSLLLPTRRLCSGGRLTKADLTIREDEAAAAAEANGDAEGVGDNFDPVPKRVKKEQAERAAPMVADGDNNVGSIEAESKLRVLVAELKRMREDDPTNKALIFTQFTQTIDWLQRRLPEEGFGFRTISGSMSAKNRDKSIQAFQKDPPTTVFILSVRSGAVGINLTAASHVFMIEPCLNPALQDQAIGRAWRMGQTRPVMVKILTVQNSIETNIVKLVQRRSTGKVADEKDSDNDERPKIIDIEQEEEEKRRAQMNKGELAGAIRADKQKLKLEEFELLFARGNLLPELPKDEATHSNAAPSIMVKDEPMKDADPRIVRGMFTNNDGNKNNKNDVVDDNINSRLENIGRKLEEMKEEMRRPLVKVENKESLSERVQNAVGNIFEKFM